MSVHAIADMRSVVAMGCMILYVYVDECQCCCIVGQCVILDEEEMRGRMSFGLATRERREEQKEARG